MRCRLVVLGLWCLIHPAGANEALNTADISVSTESSTVGLQRDLDALFLLQDATANGRQEAARLQKPLLVGIQKTIAEMKDVDPNRLAPLVTGYVLSGGDPEAARKLANADELTAFNRRLLEGVSSFMRGDRKEAAKSLGSVDVMSLPARIAGRVALAQALLEPDVAIRQVNLSLAISLMPGTLVEESALRRSALAYAEAHDEIAFWHRIERYQRRFPVSLYGREFWQEIVDIMISWTASPHPPDLEKLDFHLQRVPLPARRALYLRLARQASRSTQVKLMEFAARRVRRLALPGSSEDQIAQFYLSVYAVASENSEVALSTLQAVDLQFLTPEERALLAAGLHVASQLNLEPPYVQNSSEVESPETGALHERAESLMNNIENIISEGRS
jgi:chemotaxis protein MotC